MFTRHQKLIKPLLKDPIDTVNKDTFGNEQAIKYPENKLLFDNEKPELKFNERFHGSVPIRTREKIQNLAKAWQMRKFSYTNF